MSRIEEALKKLRTRPESGDPVRARVQPPEPAPAQPVAIKKKVTVEGPKHHVDERALVSGGLLGGPPSAAMIADEFRIIKRPLLENAANTGPEADRNMNVIMVASGVPHAGKTFCAVNLALSVSLERELNVLLVDADVARPYLSREIGLADAPGLIDLLLDDSRDLGEMIVRTDLNGIQVLPAGRRHPQATELLASERMSAVVQELSSRYPDRIVIVDSPPLLVTSEAQALASHVGQIVLIVEYGRTSREALAHTLETLNQDKAISLLLNKSRQGGRAGGGYRYYGHDEDAYARS